MPLPLFRITFSSLHLGSKSHSELNVYHFHVYLYIVTTYIVAHFTFLDSKITRVVTAAMKLKDACSLEEKL